MSVDRKLYPTAASLLLLLILLCELTLTIRQQSLSWDEGDHIFAGYMAWKTFDYGLNPEHPPLVKALATLPLLTMNLGTPALKGYTDFRNEAYYGGRDLLFGHGEAQADYMIFLVRMVAAIFTLTLGGLIVTAGKEMFGAGAALFALALMVFEPNLLAHGAYVTTDMGIACLMFASVYAIYRYVKSPSPGRLLIMGLATGLALAAKHSGVLLLPIGLALLVAEVFWTPLTPGQSRSRKAFHLAAAFAAVIVISLVVLWAFYGFRYAARPAGLALNPSFSEYANSLKGIEPTLYLTLARLHILPESYLYGLIDVRRVSNTFPTYIFGQTHAHGVWYYFPAAFLIKSTLGFMALLLVAAFAALAGKLRARREILFLTIPPLVYVLIATGTGLNIGARHILPIYPYLFVLIGGAVVALSKHSRTWSYLAAGLIAFHILSASLSYPLYIAYSNEFWGGPSNTYKYLTDSNVDWGQQLKAVKTYLDRRNIHDCWFAYFVEPVIPYSAYGIPCKPLPTADTGWFHYQVDTPPTITGTVLISAGTLTNYEFGSNLLGPYGGFQNLKPTAIIEHGVFVYDGTFDTRFASALGHVTRATDLTAAKNLDAALAEAQTAVQIDPDQFQALMILGDTLSALNRPQEAKPAYEKALAIAKTMEPSAAADWVPAVEKKLAAQ